MKIVRIVSTVFVATMLLGLTVALLQPTQVIADGPPHPDCNYECQGYVYCVNNGCQLPSKPYTYYHQYKEWGDEDCSGPFSCGQWTQCKAESCELPDPPPDTL
jgi:hypothetical protein